jgi:hypothetical protein
MAYDLYWINGSPILQMLARLGSRPDAVAFGLNLDDRANSHPSISAWLARIEQVQAMTQPIRRIGASRSCATCACYRQHPRALRTNGTPIVLSSVGATSGYSKHLNERPFSGRRINALTCGYGSDLRPL